MLPAPCTTATIWPASSCTGLRSRLGARSPSSKLHGSVADGVTMRQAARDHPPNSRVPMLRIAVRLVADTGLVATLLFTSAGTLAWRRAWVLLAVLLLVRALGAYAVHLVNPTLLDERARLP